MNRPLALLNARRLEGGAPTHVLVRDGVIADVVSGEAPAPGPDHERIEAGGRLLLPGLVDLRVKTGEPGAEPRETLKSMARAAAAAGA